LLLLLLLLLLMRRGGGRRREEEEEEADGVRAGCAPKNENPATQCGEKHAQPPKQNKTNTTDAPRWQMKR